MGTTGTASTPIHAPSSPLAPILRTLERVAGSEATVLITGATGTGKEVLARFIHERSPRATGRLVAVNCGAIPEGLIESELFGHVRGAFTGATTARQGRIAHAEGGTLFLDEIGELPPSLQVKLLRVLQERCYEPVGSTETIHAAFRLIAATNKDLEAEMRAGRFREDLYYRLFVCPVQIPLLKERREDIPVLLHHFFGLIGEVRPIEREVIRRLTYYEWPGNVRELENLAQRLSILAQGEVIRLDDLPEPYRSTEVPEEDDTVIDLDAWRIVDGGAAADPEGQAPGVSVAMPKKGPTAVTASEASTFDRESPEDMRALPVAGDAALQVTACRTARCPHASPHRQGMGGGLEEDLELPSNLPDHLRRLEARYIDAALRRTNGNRKAAAELLGLRRTTLVEKLRRRNQQLCAQGG